MKNYYVLAGSLIVVGTLIIAEQLYQPPREVHHSLSPVEFVEPDQAFTNCDSGADCIKIKGSACPASRGGAEVCVNKNYFQEYISLIDRKAGAEADVMCPQVQMNTSRVCGCVQNKCSIM
jgi:hypothetical protein